MRSIQIGRTHTHLVPEGHREDLVPEGPRGDLVPEGPREDLVPEGPREDLVPEGLREDLVPEGPRECSLRCDKRKQKHWFQPDGGAPLSII